MHNVMMVSRNEMETNKASLRISEKFDGEDGDGDISLKLKTQIANELATRLDSELRETDMTGSCGNSHPLDSTEDCSFRLFSTSDPTKRPENTDQGRRRPLVDSSSSDSDSENERLASVAVSAEQILSGSGLDTKKQKHKKKHKNRKLVETEK